MLKKIKVIWVEWAVGLGFLGLFSCAGLSPGVQLGIQVLSCVDSFYETALVLKNTPKKLEAATIVLQQADELARRVKNDVVEKQDLINAELLKTQIKLLLKN